MDSRLIVVTLMASATLLAGCGSRTGTTPTPSAASLSSGAIQVTTAPSCPGQQQQGGHEIDLFPLGVADNGRAYTLGSLPGGGRAAPSPQGRRLPVDHRAEQRRGGRRDSADPPSAAPRRVDERGVHRRRARSGHAFIVPGVLERNATAVGSHPHGAQWRTRRNLTPRNSASPTSASSALQIDRRPANARAIVSSSAYSRSDPAGSPCAGRDTVTPRPASRSAT